MVTRCALGRALEGELFELCFLKPLSGRHKGVFGRKSLERAEEEHLPFNQCILYHTKQ